MHVDVGMQSPCHKREGSPTIEMQTPVKRSKSMEDSQVYMPKLCIFNITSTNQMHMCSINSIYLWL